MVIDMGLLDLKKLQGLLDTLDAQSFRPGDSLIVSTVNHPVDAVGHGLNWLTNQVNTAAGIPDQYDNPTPWLAPSPEQQLQAAGNVAGLAQLGAFPFAPASKGGTVGTFIGPKAATWDAEKAATASKMLDEGVDPALVWKEHLIGRMPDKSLFSEIDDSGAKLRFPEDFKQAIIEKNAEINSISSLVKSLKDTKKVQDDLFPKDLNAAITRLLNDKKALSNDITSTYGLEWGANGYTGARLKYALEHGELPTAYPDLTNNVVVRLERPRNDGLKGSYHKETMDVYARGNTDKGFNATSTALHENQHAIQDYEGWAQGGSPEHFIGEGDALSMYRRLTGEAQARATQDRLNMNMQQRRENYPLAGGKLSDIPLEQLIYRYGDGGPNMAITAWHGSPHNFDKFDMSKIGTGEGAQAYGHGLYFAENPETAKSYRATLSNFGLHDGDPAKGIATLIAARGDEGEKLARQGWSGYVDDIEAEIARAKKAIEESSSLYKTSLEWPDPAREAADPLGPQHFLDWDKPLSEQPEIAKLLGDDGIDSTSKGYEAYKTVEQLARESKPDKDLKSFTSRSEAVDFFNKSLEDWEKTGLGDKFKPAAKFIDNLYSVEYPVLSKYNKSGHGPVEDSSAYLKELGIPGIRYLDGGNRGAGEGSHNYVVFDDQIPRIVERNGKGLLNTR